MDDQFLVQQVLDQLDQRRSKKKQVKSNQDFSKKFITFACIIYTVTLVIGAVSWFLKDAVPQDLLNHGTILPKLAVKPLVLTMGI